MGSDIAHPPTPCGATTRELQTIKRLHWAGTPSDDNVNRPIMLEGVGLLVELIEARNRRQSFTDEWDHAQGEQ